MGEARGMEFVSSISRNRGVQFAGAFLVCSELMVILTISVGLTRMSEGDVGARWDRSGCWFESGWELFG